MGLTIDIDSTEDMCRLMCDNEIPRKKGRNKMEKIKHCLETYKGLYEDCDDKTSRAAVDLAEDIKALERTLHIMEREAEWQADQEAHSEVTIEMEQGKDIPLREWAAKHGLDESYARQKARRGSLKTAHKVGRDWFISELEPNLDNRRRK